jgi:hypothetical protein
MLRRAPAQQFISDEPGSVSARDQGSAAEHFQANIDRHVWLDAMVAELDRSSAPILSKHRIAISDLAGMYIELTNLQRAWTKRFADEFANRDWYLEGRTS